jgi:hypothetical protein
MLECPKCGFDNELGRIFCHQCGNKLDLDKIKAPTEGAKMRRKVAGGVRKTVRTLIELAVAAMIVGGLVLICLVPSIKAIKPTNAELVAIDTKRFDLQQLTSGRKAGSIEITPGELNAYLNTLGMEKPTGSGLVFAPVTVHTEFTDHTVRIDYVGEVRIGSSLSKQLYLGLAGTPTAGPGGFAFQPTGAWIGRLPIHPKLIELTGFYLDYFAKLFAKLDNEAKSLEKLSSITVSPDKAVLSYQPPSAK